jgi:hypothetical protein
LDCEIIIKHLQELKLVTEKVQRNIDLARANQLSDVLCLGAIVKFVKTFHLINHHPQNFKQNFCRNHPSYTPARYRAKEINGVLSLDL